MNTSETREISFWNPETGSLRVSDGSTPGGMAVTGITTVGQGGPIQQSLIPDGDAQYDLGSPYCKVERSISHQHHHVSWFYTN